MLQRGDLVPHFAVSTIDGAAVDYLTIWQRRSLVLIALPASASVDVKRYASAVSQQVPVLAQHDATCVITRDPVPGLSAPGVLVADRWGEIVHIVSGVEARDLPGAPDLIDWVEYVQRRCPECEGESK